jgi:hypothetical protein
MPALYHSLSFLLFALELIVSLFAQTDRREQLIPFEDESIVSYYIELTQTRPIQEIKIPKK